MQDRVGMEAPGLSLFQGSDSIQFNMGTQRQEEEEEQEDDKRRQKELEKLLATELDELVEDDEDSSMNSSYHPEVSTGVDHSAVDQSLIYETENDKGPTDSQYLNQVPPYVYESTPYPHMDDFLSPNHSDLQKPGVYEQYGTPLSNNKNHNCLDSIAESSFEVQQPPKAAIRNFPQGLRTEINDGTTLIADYTSNIYHTPSNHYDGGNTNYYKNGYQMNENSLHASFEIGGGGDNDASSEHQNHGYRTSPNARPNNDTNLYKNAVYNSKDQLQVLYDVKLREIEKLNNQVQQLQMEMDAVTNRFTTDLELARKNLEDSNLSRNQTQNALVDARAEIIKLENYVKSLENDILVRDKVHKNTEAELSTARNSVIELQNQIRVFQSVQSLQANDKTHEKFLKQAQDKHAADMRNMQAHIDSLRTKLEEKESSYVALESKLADMRRANETLMVEKADTMNRLAQVLEESQSRCRNLMESSNTQNLMELQSRVNILTQEKEALQKTIEDLKHKLEVAKTDTIQYDSLLTTMEESDSMKHLKLGEFQSSRTKNMDDTSAKLRVELQRCIAGQAVKRKEIVRLESTLEQKNRELEKAHAMAETYRQEASHYAKRVSELEQELKMVVNEQATKAKIQIQRLSDHLTEVRSQKESLMHEKHELQHKLDETLASQEETMRRFHQETLAQNAKEQVEEYNKEYLEIHNKAVERVRHEAQLEIVQLEVQLEQTQKELDSVKEMYIDVCGTKAQLISEYQEEIKALKEASMQKYDVDQMKMELDVQMKIARKFSQECESLKKQIVELERDLSFERKKKTDYTKKIHEEIERAKDKALAELRSSHPERQISFLVPDHCVEHSDKITQLELDCKHLEEKLRSAVEDQRKMSDLQTELDDMKIKIAQMEIAHESLKKKFDHAVSEKNDLRDKLAVRDTELKNMKKFYTAKDTDSLNLSAQIKLENETLKVKCDSLLKDRVEYRNKVLELENKITEYKKKIIYLENNLSDETLTARSDLDKELTKYKELVRQLSGQITAKDRKKSDYFQEERIKQLEIELKEKDAQLRRLKDLEKIQDERDALVMKLKNQAKQFEQYVKSHKQISAELNLSPRTSVEGVEIQKIREMSVKVVREEMELKLVEQLRQIEIQHREKQKSIEQHYKSILKQLNDELEVMKQAMMVEVTEKNKLQSSFKAQEQIVTQMVEAKLNECKEELLAHKLKISQLQTELREKEHDVEEKKNLMSQYMSKWVPEVQSMNLIKTKMQEEISQLQKSECNLKEEVDQWKKKHQELKDFMETLQERYRSAKKTARNYKELAERKEKHALSECKRIEEGCKKAVNQVQQEREEMQKRVEEKMKELESQYETKLRQVRLKMKYKDKS